MRYLHYLSFRYFMVVMATWASASVSAQLHNNDIHVIINDLGNARICESRRVTINRGTEGFIKMYDLQGRDIGELAVTDEQGHEFKYVSPWNLEASFEEKAYKCGIYHADEGKELCWGISQYGSHTHHIRYTLTRLVKAYDDFDGFIFTFYQAAEPFAKHMTVTIEGEGKTFTPENTRVWSFKHYGTIFVKDGKVKVETTRPFNDTEEKMTIMVQFQKGMFHPATTVSSTFYKAVKRRALRGSEYLDTEQIDRQSNKSSFTGLSTSEGSFLDGLGWVLIIILVPVVLIATPVLTSEKCAEDKQMFRLFGNVRGRTEDWFRDIPLDGDLNKAAGTFFAVTRKKDYDALRRAHILRMIYDKRLSMVKVTDSKGNIQKRFLVAEPKVNDANETGAGRGSHDYPYYLQQLLYKAAGKDHVLDPGELHRYVHDDPLPLRNIARSMRSALSNNTLMSLSGLNKKNVAEVFGLKKFLEDFTRAPEHTLEEVALWKDYLVYATLFGIADQVLADMKKVMPDFNQLAGLDDMLYDPDLFSSTASLASLTAAAASYAADYMTPKEREQAEARAASERSHSYSSSSGGGGSSSYSGGGGGGGGGGSGYR